MKVLIVKLTSMGDLIHALPALTDAVKAIPSIRFDWVADEAFAEIPTFHPAVENVITTAHRRWNREKWKALQSGELLALWRNLRKKSYDAVIDAQSSLKSAVVTSMTRGIHYGMDKDSTREKFAHWAYNQAFTIPLAQHAIDRQRQLFAKALNYPLPTTPPDFAIDIEKLPGLPLVLPAPYLVFVHSTTWNTKHWPEAYWQALIKQAVAAGYHVALPWGNLKEQERAERLAKENSQAIVLPKLSIAQQAKLISGAAGAVCVDTGLGHLTAALNTPAVHLYGPTDPKLIGATGLHQVYLSAEYECAPCYLHECMFGPEAACFLKDMKPEKVWSSLQKIIIES